VTVVTMKAVGVNAEVTGIVTGMLLVRMVVVVRTMGSAAREEVGPTATTSKIVGVKNHAVGNLTNVDAPTAMEKTLIGVAKIAGAATPAIISATTDAT
jgi:ABC-type sulfate transport system permease component